MFGWTRWIIATRPSRRLNRTASLFGIASGPTTRPDVRLRKNSPSAKPSRWTPILQGFPESGSRQVRIRHHETLLAATTDELHAGVLVRVDVIGRALREHLLERVLTAVRRGEDEHVGDVVEKPRAGPVVPAIPVPHAPGEEVEDPLVPDHPRIEDRAVPGHGSCCDDRHVRDAHGRHRRDRASSVVGCRRHGQGLGRGCA